MYVQTICTNASDSEYVYNSGPLPHLFYINLADRTDRRERVEEQLRPVNYPQHLVHRIDAIRKNNGAIGCGLSHIRALETIQQMDIPYGMVLEDDFM
jgi:glycosyl transferase family 25